MARLINHFYRAFLGVGLEGLVACSTPQYAHRDYDPSPAARGESPVQILQRITADICEESSVTENELRCTTTTSILTNAFPAECPKGYNLISNSWGYQSCVREAVVPWGRVRKVIPGSSIVELCLDDRTCLRMKGFKDSQQARDFARAVSEYLQ